MEYKTDNNFILIGSFTKFNTVIDMVEDRLKNNIYIDPRSDKPMEMDALSLFNIQKLLNNDSITNKFITPLFTRIKQVNGFNNHNSWGLNETHSRFSSAGLKLLQAIINPSDKEHINLFNTALSSHLKYIDKLDKGIWFLHDSQEIGDSYHDYYLENKLWGSKQNNILILNTHIDTINLLLLILSNQSLCNAFSSQTLTQINSYTQEGLQGLNYVVDNQKKQFLRIDKLIRNTALFAETKSNKLLQRLVKVFFYKYRIKLKKKFPTFFHHDGYTEREIGLAGVGFYYHIINISDLAKLLIALLENRTFASQDKIILYQKLIDEGIEYAITSKSFREYMEMFHKSKLVELCETILMSLKWKENLPSKWLNYYCYIRPQLTPTAGLKGSDLTFNKAINYHPVLCKSLINKDVDIVSFSEHKTFILNYSSMIQECLTNGVKVTILPKHIEKIQ